jgi:hypothetical protein
MQYNKAMQNKHAQLHALLQSCTVLSCPKFAANTNAAQSGRSPSAAEKTNAAESWETVRLYSNTLCLLYKRTLLYIPTVRCAKNVCAALGAVLQ